MIIDDHSEGGSIPGGHDFLHALMVAQYGQIIADNEQNGMLAWVAGLCHNTDRLFPGKEVERLSHYLENGTNLSSIDREIIVKAVLKHSELNKPDDGIITIILKDADRLANIGPNIFIRSGQFYHQLPAYDPRYIVKPNPEAVYNKPLTVLDDIKFCLEWEEWLRMPKAKKLAKPYFKLLRTVIKKFEYQLKETNLLIDFPF
jgi:HD superfamily phosphodiesterase